MSNQSIINILQTVNYPGFSRDIVSFGLVHLAELEGTTAKVILELSTADQTLPRTIQKEVENALLADPQIEVAEVMVRVKKIKVLRTILPIGKRKFKRCKTDHCGCQWQRRCW